MADPSNNLLKLDPLDPHELRTCVGGDWWGVAAHGESWERVSGVVRVHTVYPIDKNMLLTRAKLQPGASSPGAKQYGDGPTNQPTDQPTDGQSLL
jgi:hypothetical protein